MRIRSSKRGLSSDCEIEEVALSVNSFQFFGIQRRVRFLLRTESRIGEDNYRLSFVCELFWIIFVLLGLLQLFLGPSENILPLHLKNFSEFLDLLRMFFRGFLSWYSDIWQDSFDVFNERFSLFCRSTVVEFSSRSYVVPCMPRRKKSLVRHQISCVLILSIFLSHYPIKFFNLIGFYFCLSEVLCWGTSVTFHQDIDREFISFQQLLFCPFVFSLYFGYFLLLNSLLVILMFFSVVHDPLQYVLGSGIGNSVECLRDFWRTVISSSVKRILEVTWVIPR